MESTRTRNWVTGAILATALASAAAAFWMTQRFLERREASIRDRYVERYRERQVLVAARPVAAGKSLEMSDLARRAMPAGFLPSGTLGAADVQEALGRRLREPLQPGDPLRLASLLPRTASNLSDRLRPGQRAVTLMVDEVNALAGLLRPGDLIDLYWQPDERDSPAAGQSLRPLLKSVPILATGERMSAAESANEEGRSYEFASITLQLAAADATRLALAQRTGEIIAMLRAAGDRSPATDSMLTLRSLLQTESPRHVPFPVPGSAVELWTGGRGTSTARVEWLRPTGGVER